MWKLIIILVLLIYLINKVSAIFYTARGQQPPRRPADSFRQPAQPPQKKEGYKGGEYIDYEEVK